MLEVTLLTYEYLFSVSSIACWQFELLLVLSNAPFGLRIVVE